MTLTATLRRPARSGPGVRTLMLHGLAGSTTVWDGFIAEAADELELWDVELPWGAVGSGEWAITGDIASPIAATFASLPARPAGEPVVDLVIAHSFGGSALLEFLSHVPGPQAAAVVLVAPLFCGLPFDWSQIGRRAEDFPRLLEEGIANRPGRRISPELRGELARRLRDLIGPLAWLRIFEYALRAALLDRDRLPMPMLVLAGAGDEVAPAVDAQQLAARLPDARFAVFGDCGHFPMVARPSEFASTVNEFALRGAAWTTPSSPE